jgi:hypothetical protein
MFGRSRQKASLLAIALSGLSVAGNAVSTAGQQPLSNSGPPETKASPNIVFILSDDQDLRMDSLSYMPEVRKLLAEQGTFFSRHYCTVALCCPSRATIWTGKEAHNTNVTDVNPPYGMYRVYSLETRG